MMKWFLSDPKSPVGLALSTLIAARGDTFCDNDTLEEADFVILCARRPDPMTLEDGSFDRLFDTVDYHLKSAFLLSRRAAQTMRRRGNGSIVFLGSSDSVKPNGRAIGFSAAMGGIRLLFRDVCAYLAASGVRVNLIEPAEAAAQDDPQKTAQLLLSVAVNPWMNGCEIHTDAAHYHVK